MKFLPLYLAISTIPVLVNCGGNRPEALEVVSGALREETPVGTPVLETEAREQGGAVDREGGRATAHKHTTELRPSTSADRPSMKPGRRSSSRQAMAPLESAPVEKIEMSVETKKRYERFSKHLEQRQNEWNGLSVAERDQKRAELKHAIIVKGL